MSLLKKILTSSLWLLIGNTVGKLAMFMTGIFAARLLPQEVFGQFSMIRNTISSIESLISGTLGPITIKKVAEVNHIDKKKLPNLLTTIFLLNFLISIILISVISLNIEIVNDNFFLGTSQMEEGLYIGLFILLASVFSSLLQNILIGFEEFRKLSTISMIVSSISIPIIYLLIMSYGFNGALFGIGTYFTLDFFFKYIFYKKLLIGFKVNYKEFKSESSKILLFSGPIFFTMLTNLFTFWYARVLIIKDTNSFNDIAIFDAAYQWLTITMIITGATTSIALTMLSKVDIKIDKTNKVFITNLLVNLLITIVFATIFIIFSKHIMSIYGESYITGAHILVILSITSIFFTLSAIYNRYFVAISKTVYILYSVLVSSAVMFLFLSRGYYTGAENLAYGFLVFYCINFSIYFILKLNYERNLI